MALLLLLHWHLCHHCRQHCRRPSRRETNLCRALLCWLIVVLAAHYRGGAADDKKWCGMAEDDDAYHQSAAAEGDAVYPHGGEAKEGDAAYCHGGAAKDNAAYCRGGAEMFGGFKKVCFLGLFFRAGEAACRQSLRKVPLECTNLVVIFWLGTTN
jgi:hypothetical protein